jgi:hypothetical protein
MNTDNEGLPESLLQSAQKNFCADVKKGVEAEPEIQVKLD